MTTASFHEVRFPLEVALGAQGGPERRTEIVTLASGREERNARWANSRRRYDAGHGVRTLTTLSTVVAFFEERRGRLTGFRYRDPLDFSSASPGSAIASSNQILGTGNGTLATFQLTKTYGSGPSAYRRDITKPVAGSVRVAVQGVEVPASGFAVDTTTGILTFVPSRIPASGAVVTAGFEFDVPVRFDSDALSIDLSAFRAGEIPSIPLIEIAV
jgi:uncharacterized protein (TIGR02217 family)